MNQRVIHGAVVLGLAGAFGLLAVTSCGRSPTGLTGQVLVHVSVDRTATPEPGMRIEIVGASMIRTTDERGMATFDVRPGHHVVRAYGIQTGGVPPPYVDWAITVLPGQVSRVEISDCWMCR